MSNTSLWQLLVFKMFKQFSGHLEMFFFSDNAVLTKAAHMLPACETVYVGSFKHFGGINY